MTAQGERHDAVRTVERTEVHAGLLSVHGGVGGVRAHLDDLHRLAALLAVAAEGLACVGKSLVRVATDPALAATALISPVSLGRAEAALARAIAGPCGGLVLAARFGGLAAAVEAAATLYETADGAAASALHAVDLVAGRALGQALAGTLLPLAAGLAVADVAVHAIDHGAGGATEPSSGRVSQVATPVSGGLATTPRVLARVLLSLLQRQAPAAEHAMDAAPGVLDGALSPYPGVGVALGALAGHPWPPRDIPEAAAMVAALGRVSPLLREPGVVTAAVVGLPSSASAPRGVADVLERVGSLYPAAGGAPGSVGVECVRHPDGRRAWVVEIPGTQVWRPLPGTNPFDLTGDIHSMAGDPTAAAATVAAALEIAGAGAGEPVLLAGHSQGGMVAAALASDPQFRARFHVTHVLSAGAPIAGYDIGDGVAVLAVENEDDLVPRLDGRSNPDRVEWVSVVVSTPGPASTPGASEPAPHAIQSYARAGAVVDASTDVSIHQWRATAAEFMNGPGVTVERILVRGVREPPAPAG